MREHHHARQFFTAISPSHQATYYQIAIKWPVVAHLAAPLLAETRRINAEEL